MADGVLSSAAGRFQIGVAGDVVVLGRWNCAATSLPADLRPATGQIWVFDHWPLGDDPVSARLVGNVSGARSLRVIPGHCDQLLVRRSGGKAPVTLNPRNPDS
jgi:hypothetical protein